MSYRQAFDHLGKPLQGDETPFNLLLLIITIVSITAICFLPSPEAFGL